MSVPRPVLRYHGGKFRLAARIVDLFPKHRMYVEPFAGAASVLMHKPKVWAEIYNDLDCEVVNVFRVLQNPRKAKQLERLLRVTPFSRAEFELSYRKARCDIEQARRTLIRSFMGFGSDSVTRMKASDAGFNSRVTGPGPVMRTGFRGYSMRSHSTAAVDWSHYSDAIRCFTERLQGVLIENRDAFRLIEKMDRQDALFYVDPPYPFEVLQTKNKRARARLRRYRHVLSDVEHVKLAELLHRCCGMVLVSGYAGPLYSKLYADWERTEWNGNEFCHGAANRTECVWLNAAAARLCPIGRLF